MECAPSEDSDQPGHPPNLIRIFAVCMKKAWVLSYPMSTQRRLWSDWADAQADLSLRWAHMLFCWFCHEAAPMSDADQAENCLFVQIISICRAISNFLYEQVVYFRACIPRHGQTKLIFFVFSGFKIQNFLINESTRTTATVLILYRLYENPTDQRFGGFLWKTVMQHFGRPWMALVSNLTVSIAYYSVLKVTEFSARLQSIAGNWTNCLQRRRNLKGEIVILKHK